MGYGLGTFLLAVGLILALAVQDGLSGLALTTAGWIMAAVGAAVLIMSFVTWNNARRSTTVARTTHPDGSQTVNERRNEF